MLSAFGVDHGDSVSKARVPFLRGNPHKVPKGSVPSRASQIKGSLNRLGDTPITVKGVGRGAGKAVAGVGHVFEGYPGLTGTALVGGGGAAGYHHLKNKEPRKR